MYLEVAGGQAIVENRLSDGLALAGVFGGACRPDDARGDAVCHSDYR